MPTWPRWLGHAGLWLAPLLLVPTLPPAAPGADPLEVAQAVDVALNAHDAQAVMALMAAGGTVQEDRAPQSGEQVRGWVEQLIDEDVSVELIGQPRVESTALPPGGTRVSWPAKLALDRFRALGLGSVEATLGVVVVDGRIRYLWIRPAPDWSAASTPLAAARRRSTDAASDRRR
jgi:hypothetical protein